MATFNYAVSGSATIEGNQFNACGSFYIKNKAQQAGEDYVYDIKDFILALQSVDGQPDRSFYGSAGTFKMNPRDLTFDMDGDGDWTHWDFQSDLDFSIQVFSTLPEKFKVISPDINTNAGSLNISLQFTKIREIQSGGAPGAPSGLHIR